MNFYKNGLTGKLLSGCLGIVLLVIAFGALGAFIFMLLWNWLIPLFWHNAPILTFWESWGIIILLSIIGSFFKANKISNI